MTVAYDTIADWYENEFLSGRSADGLPISDLIGVDGSLRDLLGQGTGVLSGDRLWDRNTSHGSQFGWSPVGIDLSLRVLRHARARLAIRGLMVKRCRSGTPGSPVLFW